ncbi:MAG: tetratricopeptide repeat protein, partial [Planctomycetota bacterium JB042]
FLKRWPDHERSDHARYRLATACFELDRFEDAIPHLRKLMIRAGFEFEAEAAFRLAECELRAKRYDRAISALERVASLDEAYLRDPTTFLLGEATFRKGDFAAARGHYATLLDRAPNGEHARDARYGLAWCAFRLGEHDAARVAIDAFLRRHPGDPLAGELVFLRGECLLEAGRPEEALAAYAEVPDGPFRDAALRGLGFASAALGRAADAAAAFEAIVRRHPESRYASEAALQGGIQALKADDPRRAVALLSTPAAGVGPEVRYWRGRAKQAAGDREGALADLDAALRTVEDEALRERLQVARGDLLFELGRTDAAAKAYGGSKSDYALHAAAVASLNEGRFDDARRLAEEFVARHEESPYAAATWIVLGECRLAAKEHDAAIAAFERALGADRDRTETARVRGRLGWCRFLSGDGAGAAAEFRRAVEAGAGGDELAEARYMLGRSLEASGDPDGAREAWRTYRREHRDGPHAADVLLGLARLEEGAEGTARLEELLARHADHETAPDALFALAERLSEAGRTDEAAKRYGELLSRFPRHAAAAPARYGLAWCLYGAERFPAAARELRTLLDDRSLAPDVRLAALELLVFAEQRAPNPAGMVEAFDRFRRECRDDARVLAAGRACAETLATAGKADDADRLLRSIRTTDGAATRALRIERAYLALDGGDAAGAAERIQALVQQGDQDPTTAEAAFFVAEALFEAGDDARAVPLYAYAARVEGSGVVDRALYKEGFSRMRGGDLEGAVRAFASLGDDHRNSPLWGETQYLRGELLYRLDRLEEAAKALARLRREIPNHAATPKALFRLGLALCRTGAWGEGEEALTELVRKNADFEHLAEAELWRGRALASREKPRAARQAFERVIQSDRGVLGARARLELGRLHFAGGDPEKALSEFLKVSVLYAAEEENAEALYLAGLCLEKVGDPQKAKSQYREIVEKYPRSAFAANARERLAELKAF